MVKTPRVVQSDKTEKVWNRAELDEFLSMVRDDRLRALWHLAAWSGMRRQEVLGLRWADLDLDAGRVTVRRTWVVVNGKPQEGKPKTDRSGRTIELDAATVAVMRSHRVAQLQDRMAAATAWTEGDWIFRWEDGRRLLPDWVSRRFDELVEASGLPRITFRNLRDSHATLFFSSGFSAKVLAERLGHHDPAFTLRVYGAAGPTLQRAAIESLAAK